MTKLTYKAFEAHILRMAISATHEARNSFARDTLEMLRQLADDEAAGELTEEEYEAFDLLGQSVEADDPNVPVAYLNQITESMFAEEDDSREFSVNVVEYLDAVDDWLCYRDNRDPNNIASIAIHHVNCIDYRVDPTESGYSVSDMLAAPEMAQEYARIKSFLE